MTALLDIAMSPGMDEPRGFPGHAGKVPREKRLFPLAGNKLSKPFPNSLTFAIQRLGHDENRATGFPGCEKAL